MNEERKTTLVVNQPNELAGCGILLIGLGVCVASIIWAITGFPEFWK